MSDPRHTILVVDDEPNVRLVFRTSLETAGFTVDEADDGDTALDRLRTSPAALVLLDLRMPGGGLETLRRLRDAGDDVPVVIVTAHGSIPDAVAAMKLGAVDFLTKPIKPEALRNVVADVIRRHADAGSSPEPIPASSRLATSNVARLSLSLATTSTGLGLARRALNRRESVRARDLLEAVLELDPDSAEAHNLMGVLRESLGQDRAAYEAYRAALETDPDYGPALDNMRRYCERAGLDSSNWSINPCAECHSHGRVHGDWPSSYRRRAAAR